MIYYLKSRAKATIIIFGLAAITNEQYCLYSEPSTHTEHKNAVILPDWCSKRQTYISDDGPIVFAYIVMLKNKVH